MKKNILVTGPPGCGKSTLIGKVLSGIRLPAAGFLTREIREEGRRVGFCLETIDGKKEILADTGLKSSKRVGKYGVNIEALERVALDALQTSSTDTVIVIDEIGKMECLSSLFRRAVLQVLDSPNIVLASIAERGDRFMEEIKSRNDVLLHRINAVNRDLFAKKIIHELRALSTAD